MKPGRSDFDNEKDQVLHNLARSAFKCELLSLLVLRKLRLHLDIAVEALFFRLLLGLFVLEYGQSFSIC